VAIGLARHALSAEPSGVLTDYDGTLSAIVGDPADARLADGAGDALAALARRLAVVAVITGRAAADARRHVDVPGVLVVGNHGVEWLEAGSEEPSAPPGAAAVAERLDTVLDGVPTPPGVVVERKGLSGTVHYRNATHPGRVRAAILEAVSAAASHGIEVREGRMSVELRPRDLGDKGQAARAIVARHGLRGAVVLGDDLTDLDMFAAIADLRDRGELRGAIIAVDGADREAPREVIAAADAVLGTPAEVAELLEALAAR
jgi:trehalose 6-phosphate phosphatase